MIEDLVSIIIVNYNTEQLLEDCIVSIGKHTRNVNCEIIVVDNNSEQGSLSSLAEKYPTIRFHLSDENQGFGRANNIGASIAKGEYLFFLNPDTLLINNAIFILYEYLKKHSEVGICGGNLYRGDMKPAVSFHILDFYKRELRILLNKKWKQGFNHSDQPQAVKVIMGADLFISKSLFLKYNGFDEDFFMYFEEVELCDRIRKTGYKIMSVPEAKIIHLEGGAAENKNEDLHKWSYQEHWYSKFIYFSKTKGKTLTRVIYFLHISKLELAVLFYSLKRNKTKINYWTQKRDVIKGTFNRYQEYLSNKS
ncbi:glycosyltransferase family 2 protein [Dysgonomonas sp. GY617]|uniref:glycosyltransferase family 2 protein n=1 Tax=Dysgonomonas sp. GY617 TaxID=2780420 RepID=UPI0018831A1F|nr:glycosyltransferase family 2 protein [Dysgonomonas sp. GY617]MBF0575760.1 glycosyltransferase family 2 protein [Dysgonomonas sp. GY617]